MSDDASATVACHTCGKSLAISDALLDGGGHICASCQLDAESAARAGGFHPLVIAAGVAIVVPFFVTMQKTETSIVDGEVEFVFRDWVAIGAGAAAIAIGVVLGLALARKRITGPVNLAAAVVAVGLGGYHLAAGFGGFAEPPDAPARVDVVFEDEAYAGDKESSDGQAGSNEAPPVVVDSSSGCNATAPAACEVPCADGDAEACNSLAVALYRGEAIEQDLARARELLERACTTDSPLVEACKNLGLLLVELEDDEAAIKAYGLACDRDHAGACNDLAVLLRGADWLADALEAATRACVGGNNTGCLNRLLYLLLSEVELAELEAPDELFVQACAFYDALDACVTYVTGRPVATGSLRIGFYQWACDQGSGEACNEVGHFADADGPDGWAPKHALFVRACDLGNALGCLNAAADHVYDRTSYDESLAIEYLARACPTRETHPTCGRIYADREVDQAKPELNRSTALRWCAADDLPACADLVVYLETDDPRLEPALRRACDADIALGCNNLAVVLRDRAVPDLAAALPAAEKGCELGDVRGCINAGSLAWRGAAGAPDPTAAARWYRRACELGATSSCSIAERVESGEVHPDLVAEGIGDPASALPSEGEASEGDLGDGRGPGEDLAALCTRLEADVDAWAAKSCPGLGKRLGREFDDVAGLGDALGGPDGEPCDRAATTARKVCGDDASVTAELARLGL